MTAQDLHRCAIEKADFAFIEKFKGNLEVAESLFNEAFVFEKDAAFKAISLNIGEPTISILLKSAASLAINSNLPKEAEKLICLALSGEPPFEIAEELRNLLEELHFQRHLQLQNIKLNPNELQLVMAGRGIGYGMAKSETVFDKISIFEKLTYRTAERIAKKEFRTTGPIPKPLKTKIQPYISIPRAASFAFTIRIGEPDNNKLYLDDNEWDNANLIFEDIIENINLINNGKYEELKNRIIDNHYFNNFINLTKEFAPDGEEINLVGLTIIKNNQPIEAKFTKLRKTIASEIIHQDNDVEIENTNISNIQLTGRLFAANEDNKQISLKVNNKETHKIIVPDGLSDIVKKYWDEQVSIIGSKDNNSSILLISIDPI